MVQLAGDRGLDFTAADPWDPQWNRRLSVLLHERNRRAELESVALQYEEAAYALTRDLSADSRVAVQGVAERLRKKRLKLIRPWIKIDVSQTEREDSYSAMSEAWKRHWGDPNDPATKAKIDSTVAWLNQNSRAPHG
jgi:hypothetical protein